MPYMATQGKLPAWIGLPPSVAVPFGSFEAALGEGINQGVAQALPPDHSGPPSRRQLHDARCDPPV